MTGCWTPCRWYRQALVASVEESQHITTEDITDVLHSTDTGSIWLYRPMRHVKRCVHHWQVIFFRRVLKRERYEFFFYFTRNPLKYYNLFFVYKYQTSIQLIDKCLDYRGFLHKHCIITRWFPWTQPQDQQSPIGSIDTRHLLIFMNSIW